MTLRSSMATLSLAWSWISLARLPIVSLSALLFIQSSLTVAGRFRGLAVASLAMMLMSGYMQNDVDDVQIDRIAAPHRPLVAGHISMNAAVLVQRRLFQIAVVLCLSAGLIKFSLYLTMYRAAFYLYSKGIRTSWWLKNGFTSLWFASIAASSLLVAQGEVSALFPLLSATFGFTFFREVVMDERDRAGDQLTSGIRRLTPTLARYGGIAGSMIAVALVLEVILKSWVNAAFLATVVAVVWLPIHQLVHRNPLWHYSEWLKTVFLIGLAIGVCNSLGG